jgi:alpha-1,6-mannosyltransferase
MFYGAYRRVIQRFIARGVDTFTAAAEECKAFLMAECGVAGTPEVVPLGVDPERFQPNATQRSAVRYRLGLPRDALAVIYTGKVIPAKRVDVLIEAIAELRAALPDISCLIVGDAEPGYEKLLTTLIERYGLKAHVRAQGSVSQADLGALYSAADIAVWPAMESMAIFEAMASGLPVVVSDRSAYAALVEQGPGLTYSADDPGALATALRRLKDAPHRRAMGATGRDIVLRTRTWRSSAESYVRIYKEAMRGRGHEGQRQQTDV